MTAAKRPKPKAEETHIREERRARMSPQFLAARAKWNAEQKAKVKERRVEMPNTEDGKDRAHEVHQRMMGDLSKGGPKGSPSRACHCGRPALYIIRRYKQPDAFVCALHRK